MVRYPEAERRSLQQFEEIRVRTPAGDEVPLPELADREVHRTRSNILRLDQSRAITISAGIDDRVANVQEVVGDLTNEFFPALFDQHPGIRVRWEGDQEETMASLRSLFIGFAIAMFGIFLLLAERSAHPADRAGDAQASMAAGRALGPLLGGAVVSGWSFAELGLVGAAIIASHDLLRREPGGGRKDAADHPVDVPEDDPDAIRRRDDALAVDRVETPGVEA